jgi:DNA transposition AAA+ family ATPase
MAKKRSSLLTDQLRQVIDDSGFTRYQIAKATGIDESALAKFYNGRRGQVPATDAHPGPQDR